MKCSNSHSESKLGSSLIQFKNITSSKLVARTNKSSVTHKHYDSHNHYEVLSICLAAVDVYSVGCLLLSNKLCCILLSAHLLFCGPDVSCSDPGLLGFMFISLLPVEMLIDGGLSGLLIYGYKRADTGPPAPKLLFVSQWVSERCWDNYSNLLNNNEQHAADRRAPVCSQPCVHALALQGDMKQNPGLG